jgi:DNA-binding XRE family transcriptional regulator
MGSSSGGRVALLASGDRLGGVFSRWVRRRRARGDAVAEPPVTFAGLLRELRTGARLTQEELAEAAGLSPRSVSDLERGIAQAPRRETVRLLADALGLTGPVRAQFEAVARGRPGPAGPVTAGAAAMRTLPPDNA